MIGKKKSKPTVGWLRKIGVPAVLIPGIIFATIYGVKNISKLGPDYYKNKQVFPTSGYVEKVEDGDTLTLKNGAVVRLYGIDAPDRGEKKYAEATELLGQLVDEKKIWLEYDRYQDDKYGRIMAWVWTGCGDNPKLLQADYMRLSLNQSKEGLMTNPVGCERGKLVQEEMVKAGLAAVQVYEGRGELKYQKRLLQK
jgi:endonuclease YncB( thermonuclease family)